MNARPILLAVWCNVGRRPLHVVQQQVAAVLVELTGDIGAPFEMAVNRAGLATTGVVYAGHCISVDRADVAYDLERDLLRDGFDVAQIQGTLAEGLITSKSLGLTGARYKYGVIRDVRSMHFKVGAGDGWYHVVN